MLQRSPLQPSTAAGAKEQSFLEMFDPAEMVAIVRRQWPVILACAVLVVSLAVAYLIMASPRYTATASILIDTRKNQLFQTQQVVGDAQIDSSAVESQAEILRSEAIALAVIRGLKLAEDPEFNGSNTKNPVALVLSWVMPEGDPPSQYRLERAAVGTYLNNLNVKRVGTTYAIGIEYTALSAKRAAEVANRITEAYIDGEMDAKYQATRRAGRWLQDRIADLREQASVADAAVQKFKAEHNIVDTGRGLMNDQQLVDMNTQAINARAAVAEAKAKLDRIRDISQSNIPDATVTDALRNEVITRLRSQYLDLSAREADFSKRFGATHTATANLRSQMVEKQRSIADELGRIAQTYQSEYEIALAREASVRASLEELVGQANLTGQAQIKLRDLESTSQTYRNLYDNFLQRFTETTQQQSFPVSEARVVTAATEPISKSAPKSSLVLAAGGFFGLCLGFLAALVRERLDDGFRDVLQVEQLTGMEALGIVPEVTARSGAGEARKNDPERRLIDEAPNMRRYVINAPFSRFAEALRGVKVATDITRLTNKLEVIGVVSALPNEGKTTVAVNLAQLIAQTGQRTVLVDADLRNPSLSRMMAVGAQAGLLEVLTGRASEAEVRWTDRVTGLHFIPTVAETKISHSNELLASPRMAELLAGLRTQYDYVILDLPPVIPVVDVKAASHLIDGFLLVIQWGRTTKSAISEALAGNPVLQAKSIGAVLNRAHPGMLRRLEGYKGNLFQSYYSEGANDRGRRDDRRSA